MKIGELAKQTGLSIRTLHYYDEIGLLSPSHRTEIGHRLYSDRDITRLQQIVSLRQLGFSLKEIRECLENPEFSLPQVIDLHRARLREQMALSNTLINRLDAIAADLQNTQSVAVENLIQAMEVITMTTQYFTPEQQVVLDSRFQEGEAEWQALLSEVRTEMNKGTDLNSPSVRKLARRWLWSMKSFVQGDEEIYESLTQMYQQAGPAAASWGTLDTATFEYILKAVSFLTLADFTDLLIPTAKIFTPETQQVFRLGEAAIRQLNIEALGTEGLLLGFLEEGTSIAAQVLMAAGVTFEAAQAQIVTLLGAQPAQPADADNLTRLPVAPRVKLVIELSLELAEQSGQSLITPEHLLLGILKEAEAGGGVATYALREGLGIDLAHLEQQVRSAMSQS
ncbi:MAG: MerR family transcriptional regulator [Cyanobacteria bacterium P01_G01_bin.38]